MDFEKILIVCDFDYTIANNLGEISPFSVEVINEFINRGGHFAFCSGRSLPSIRSVTELYGLKAHYIAGHGCVVVDNCGNELHRNNMELDLAHSIFEKMRSFEADIYVFISDEVYTERKQRICPIYISHTSHPACEIDCTLSELLITKNLPIQKFLVVSTPDRIAEYTQIFNDGSFNELIDASNSAPNYLEIVHKRSLKSVGVKQLAEHLSIPFSSVYAFGDSGIDRSMLSFAGVGVAVGNATQLCKDSANIILERTNDQDAVAHYILETLLNNK